jgi:hypothetical protein
MSDFDISKQPSPAGIGKPGSGTYGEKAALDRLKASLPEVPPGAGPTGTQQAPMPLPPAGSPGAPAPSAAPADLFAPTQRPDVPVSTPLQMGGPAQSPVQAAATARQRNMAVLDSLANDPNVSDVTREWAQNLISNMVRMSAR